MRIIELDASCWETPLDFIRALQRALDAPFWCGSNVDAINELMVWGLGAGEVPPPYVVHISSAAAAPKEVQRYIAQQAKFVLKARAEKKLRGGIDVNVSIKF